jgi:hypothetical protein
MAQCHRRVDRATVRKDVTLVLLVLGNEGPEFHTMFQDDCAWRVRSWDWVVRRHGGCCVIGKVKGQDVGTAMKIDEAGNLYTRMLRLRLWLTQDRSMYAECSCYRWWRPKRNKQLSV